MAAQWSWIWPQVGATPINQGLDSEMFDRTDYPYSETFVREAIQNSLDARLDPSLPVHIRFAFHEDKIGKRRKFLQQAMDNRETAGLPVPGDWNSNKVRWITVEDSNTRGLLGSLENRKGDFWGYWLNFGLSNKTGTGRGGRGIGRVTFLIASRMHSVLGLSRRSDDGSTAGCGMCVLRADQYGDDFKSTHAYLAAAESGSVYALHDSPDFHRELEEAFNLQSYADNERTGLSLVIPYPHDELDEDGILAAAIDHFAPAILSGNLVVEVGVDRLDQAQIAQVAPCVADRIKTKALKSGVGRYLNLIKAGLGSPKTVVSIPGAKSKLSQHRETAEAEQLRSALAAEKTVIFKLMFPMVKGGVKSDVGIVVVAAPTPYGSSPIDRLFREGMGLPDVKSARPSDIDIVMLVEDEPLAQYLNFCEGKAHLDLLESKEVKQKLAEAGFEGGVDVRRLVKGLPDTLREYLTEESQEPDKSVWESYFSIADTKSEKRKVPQSKKDEDTPEPPPPPPPPPPPANVSAVLVDALPNGFRIKANPAYQKFPAKVEVTIAYADGSAKPSWSEFDFKAKDLAVTETQCEVDFTENKLRVPTWTADSCVEVSGFDTTRELDTRIRTESHASED